MNRLFTLPSAAALAIAGVGGGILVGNTAVDSINPFFYSPLPQKSFASLSAYRSPTTGGEELSAEESAYALGNGCVGCNTYPEEYRPDSSYEEQMTAGYHAASLGAENGFRPEASEAVAAPAVADPERSAVARYASYPVTETERDLRTIEQHAAEQSELAITERADAESLRAAEDNAVPRGPEQLVY